MIAAIQTEHICFHAGAFQLRDISLSIPAGKMTAIVGPNGSGKSTLLKIISRLLKADEGIILIEDIPANQYKSLHFAKTVAMLTQSKQSLPDLTVKELISYGRSPYKRIFDRMTAEDHDIVDWALEVTGTTKHADRQFYTLSGGEQQKARIALALVQRTHIILLDEPTTYLDIAHQLEVMEMLQQINRDYNYTMLMVLHDLQQAASYCDYMIAMKDGQIATTGSPKQILSPQLLMDIYNIEARVRFEDNYPLIIPLKTLKNQRRN